MMIYLLGVDHQVQWAKHTQISMVFKLYLEKKVEEYNIKFIAEEWSEGLLQVNGVKTTVPQDVAIEYSIDHRFCDPSLDERKRIGWKSKADDNLREQFWLEKIKDKTTKNIIFVCGSDHLETFSNLIKKSQYKVEIIPKRFDLKTYTASGNKDF